MTNASTLKKEEKERVGEGERKRKREKERQIERQCKSESARNKIIYNERLNNKKTSRNKG